MERSLMEVLNPVIGLVPVDFNDGSNTGLRISMKNVKRLLFLFVFGDSTAAVTNFSLKQHDAATAGTTKALSVANAYYYKVNGIDATDPKAWTKVVPNSATDNFIPTALAGDPGMVAFEVLAEDLDREGNFQWASIDAADATAAKLGACIVLAEHQYKPAHDQKI